MKAAKDALIEINVTKANTKIVRFLFLKLWQDKKLKLPNELLPMKEIFFDRTAQFKLREPSAF